MEVFCMHINISYLLNAVSFEGIQEFENEFSEESIKKLAKYILK